MNPANKSEHKTCFNCAYSGPDDWTLYGYDEFGPLWLCSKCRPKFESGELPENEPPDTPPSRSG